MGDAADILEFLKIEASNPQFELGGIRHVTAYSKGIRGRADLSLWIPAVASGVQDLPIVILLHGVYGSHWSWFFHGGAHRIAAEAILGSVIRPVVLACPSDGLWGEGSGYLPVQRQNFEAWICSVPRLVEQIIP